MRFCGFVWGLEKEEEEEGGEEDGFNRRFFDGGGSEMLLWEDVALLFWEFLSGLDIFENVLFLAFVGLGNPT